MNFQAGMIPGICALAVGALLTFFSDKLCHREKNVPQMKLLGVALAVVYRLMEHREKGNDYGKQSRSDGQGV